MEWGTRRSMVLLGQKGIVERWSFLFCWGCRMMWERTRHFGRVFVQVKMANKMTLQYLYWWVPFISRQGKSFTHDLPHKIKKPSLTYKKGQHSYQPTIRLGLVCTLFATFGFWPSEVSEVLTLHSESTARGIGNQNIWSLAYPTVPRSTWVPQFAGTVPTKVGALSSILRGELLGFFFW